MNDSRIQYPIGVVYGGKVCIEKQLSVRDSLVCLSPRRTLPKSCMFESEEPIYYQEANTYWYNLAKER